MPTEKNTLYTLKRYFMHTIKLQIQNNKGFTIPYDFS